VSGEALCYWGYFSFVYLSCLQVLVCIVNHDVVGSYFSFIYLSCLQVLVSMVNHAVGDYVQKQNVTCIMCHVPSPKTKDVIYDMCSFCSRNV
jgi:hypothetical protein